MSGNTTYYVDINSQYRDVEKYPNPADFAVSFSTNNQTGYFPQGLPISPSGYFQQASIDPDFVDADLKIYFVEVNRYERVGNSLFISGSALLYYSNIVVIYKSTVIFQGIGLDFVYSFIPVFLRIDIVDEPIPYKVKWCISTKPIGINELIFVNYTPVYFCLTSDNNIYTFFGYANNFDLIIQNENNEVSSLYSNINTPYGDDAPTYNMFYYTFLFDFDGNLGLYDNHVWGYHTFGSSISQTDRSTFNISDNGKNFYIGLRPYPATYTIQEIDTKFIYQQNALYPRDIYTYTGVVDNPLVFYHVWYTFDDDNIQVNPALTTGAFYVATDSFTGSNVLNIKYINTPSNITSIGYADYCETNTDVYAIANYFTSYTGDFNSPATGGLINPDLPLQYFIFDKTGVQFNYITETPPGSYNGYMLPQSISYNNDIYTFGRASFTGTDTSSLLYAYKLNTSTNTVSKVATIGFTGANYTNSKIFTVKEGGYIYVLCNDFDVFSVSNDNFCKGFVVRFDPATNTMIQYSEYQVLASSIAYQNILEKDGRRYMITTYSSNNDTDFYDITDLSNISDIYTTTDTLAKTLPIIFQKTVNGLTTYYLHSQETSGFSASLLNINNLSKIAIVAPYNYSIYVVHINKEGYVYCISNFYNSDAIFYSLSFSIPPFFYGSIYEKSAAYGNVPLESTHYTQNLSNTYDVPVGSNCIDTFNYPFYDHLILTVLGQDYIQFYSVDDKFNLILQLEENISLPNPTNVLKSFTHEDKQWIFVCQSNECLVYTIDLTTTISLTYVETITTGWTIVDLNVLLKDDILTLILFNNSCDMNTYQYSTMFNYISTFNFVDGTYDSYGSSYSFYRTNDGNYYTYAAVNNTPLLNKSNRIYINISDLTNITIENNTEDTVGAGQGYKSTSIIQSGFSLMFGSYFSNSSLISGINILELLNYGSHVPAGFLNLGDFNGTSCMKFFLLDNVLHMVCNRSNPGDPTEYLACYRFNIANAFGISVVNQFYYTVTLEDSCIDLTAVSVGTKTMSISLLNNNKIYLYDITNPSFAGENQKLTKVTKTYYDDNFLGIATTAVRTSIMFHKVLADGTPDWGVYYGATVSSRENACGIVSAGLNLGLDSTQQNLYVAFTFATQMQCFNYTSTGFYKSQEITNNNYSQDRSSGIVKLNTINGNSIFLLPLYGLEENAISALSYISSDNSIVFDGSFTSNISTFYNPQPAGSFVNPTTVQRILIKKSSRSGFIGKINNNGIIQWLNLLYTDDTGKTINVNNITSDNNKIVAWGYSNTNTMRCIDSSGSISQILYSPIGTSTDRNAFFYTFTPNGIYQQSNLIVSDRGRYTVLFLRAAQNRTENELVYIIPAFYTSSTFSKFTCFNKDGTLGGITSMNDYLFEYSTAIIRYKYDSTYYDDNNQPYSQVVFNGPTSYPFTGDYFDNYYLYIGGNKNSTGINKSFTIRNNFTGPNNNPSVILNTNINISNIDRQFETINGIPNSNRYFFTNISKSPLTSIIKYDTTNINTGTNQITVLSSLSPINTNQFYYVVYPYNSFTNKIIPVVDIEDIGDGEYIFTLEYTDDLQSPTGGAYYGPYLYLASFNQSLYYNLQFFPGSIAQPVYYTVRLQSMTIPNRPLLNLNNVYGGSRTLNDLPFIYLSVYNVDDNDNYDSQIVNVVYDSTPLDIKPYPVFQIPVSNQSSTNNFATFSSDIQPVVKFSPGYYNIRIRLFDMNGNPLLFDTSSSKPSDLTYTGGIVPSYLTNLYFRMAFTKR
jgi:hypothetical protein